MEVHLYINKNERFWESEYGDKHLKPQLLLRWRLEDNMF
jgi:hypothetical protein